MDQVICPHCHQVIRDLLDHDWQRGIVETDCPHCEQEVAISLEVTYTFSVVVPESEDE